MSNIIENNLRLTGPAVSVTRAMAICHGRNMAGEESHFTLNAIVPRPPSLNVNSGTSLDVATWAMDPDAGTGPAWLQSPLLRSWYPDAPAELRPHSPLSKWREWLKTLPDVAQLGEAGNRNISLHGAKSWYEWDYGNWGCRCDACRVGLWDTSEGSATIHFDTANGPPYCALRVLSLMVRDVTITCDWVDEGGWAGTLAYEGGMCTRNDRGNWSDFPHGRAYEARTQAGREDDAEAEESEP